MSVEKLLLMWALFLILYALNLIFYAPKLDKDRKGRTSTEILEKPRR